MILTAIILAATLTTGNGSPQIISDPCLAWHSEVTPPRTIRVRLSEWRIVSVPFARYTAVVLSSEFNTVPDQLRLAGAVSVRQYGWVKAMHPRHSRFGCFDVWADTRDQIFRPGKTPPDYIWQAVRATWSWRLYRAGRLVSTGYRTGRSGVGCGRDIDGWHLFARSAAKCARAGWGARRILETYFEAKVRT